MQKRDWFSCFLLEEGGMRVKNTVWESDWDSNSGPATL